MAAMQPMTSEDIDDVKIKPPYEKERIFMLRFCDKEVFCVEYGFLNRDELRKYFLSGHLNDMVCVYDDCSRWEGYKGRITFHSLIQYADVYDAIQKECVFLNENIWENARNYFKYNEDSKEKSLLPVLDENRRLICFAYQDLTADRQLRMLRELNEVLEALDFKALYPEYDSVTIYDCNELAYLFSKYLKQKNISVKLVGDLWKYFEGEKGNPDECETLEYKNYKVYAEGISQAKKEFLPDILRSAAPEFECIDQIYEANIRNGIIRDAEGDIEWLLEKLRGEKELVILGTGVDSQNACDFLLGKEIEARCFISDGWTQGKLLGKDVLSDFKVKEKYKKVIFLDCESENSAWGFGKTDKYDCEGYYRNKQFFCLRDYIKIPIGGLFNTIRNKNIVLVGDFNLCSNLNRILKENGNFGSAYWDVLNENSEKGSDMLKAAEDMVENADIYLLVDLFYYGCSAKSRKHIYMKALQMRGIDNITDYFSDSRVFMSIQKKGGEKYTLPDLMPRGILLGASGHMCGNILISHLLDGHPNICFMPYSFLRNNLYIICMWLAEEKAENMLSMLWELDDRLEDSAFRMSVVNRKIFENKFKELLGNTRHFTSQEIFVMLSIAGAAVYGRDVETIQDMVIYWEPHDAPKEFCKDYEEWLSDSRITGCSINLMRNSVARAGSYFKHCESMDAFVYPGLTVFWTFMDYLGFEEERLDNWKRIEMKFEDLKTSPKEKLNYICQELEIPWSDTLLETTAHGEKGSYVTKTEIISGWDLKPVYNLYEEYFSDFDRFRINMVFAELQKKGNYPYVSCQKFTRRQLQEMFLKEFRFEESRLEFQSGDKGKIEFREKLFIKVNEHLQRLRIYKGDEPAVK